MIVYKLFRERRDGSIGPLFIDASKRIPLGEWMAAEDHPTRGYAHRPGWHCTLAPVAPHLSEKGRRWYVCEAIDVRKFNRPQSQGGTWVLANMLRVIRPL